MLPGHRTGVPRKATINEINELPHGAAAVEPEESDEKEKSQGEETSEIGDTPQAPPIKARSRLNELGPGDADEYGPELGKDARFWKTYVKETDQWDAELVDGWNKSLDVTLIFAALFSAISTAFVIESSKKLEPNPTEVSAQSLLLISQTLLVMSGNNQSSLSVPTAGEANFSPTSLVVCVNVLWFLSLSLSVGVSLVAMLAKEWCYLYMFGRTGHPYQQTRRRQQLWDGLVRWKMQEVLELLPSLMHLALLLFAIGLSIYLWDIHRTVALPVVAITSITLGFYALSTILPFFHAFCPYNTTLSRLVKLTHQALVPTTRPKKEEEKAEHDDITSRALHWVIMNCEVPSSVDVALQAIAGATGSLPRELLEECEAATLICRRLTSISSYVGNSRLAISRYLRALAFLKPRHSDPADGTKKSLANENSERLESVLKRAQLNIRGNVFGHLLRGDFTPTSPNLTAVNIGDTAASHCRHKLSDTPVIESAISLYEDYALGVVVLHRAAEFSLLKSVEMFCCCALIPRKDDNRSAFFPTKLARLLLSDKLPDHISHHVGVLLSAYALSQRDYPGWRLLAPLDSSSRAERAMEMIEYHTHPSIENYHHNTSGLLVFGLMELLRHYGPDSVDDADYNMIISAAIPHLSSIWNNKEAHVFSFAPPSLAGSSHQQVSALAGSSGQQVSALAGFSHERASDILVHGMAVALGKPQAELTASNEARIRVCLKVLCTRPQHLLTVQDYAFVIESLCRVQSLALANVCTSLLMTWDIKTLPENDLNDILRTRNILGLLLHKASEHPPRHPRTALFAMSLLWQHVTRILSLQSDAPEELLSPILPNIFIRPILPPSMLRAKIKAEFVDKWLPLIQEMPASVCRHIRDSNLLKQLREHYPDSAEILDLCSLAVLRGALYSWLHLRKTRRDRETGTLEETAAGPIAAPSAITSQQ